MFARLFSTYTMFTVKKNMSLFIKRCGYKGFKYVKLGCPRHRCQSMTLKTELTNNTTILRDLGPNGELHLRDSKGNVAPCNANHPPEVGSWNSNDKEKRLQHNWAFINVLTEIKLQRIFGTCKTDFNVILERWTFPTPAALEIEPFATKIFLSVPQFRRRKKQFVIRSCDLIHLYQQSNDLWK